jgi:DNA-binding MarR family transcriptional regulator
MPTSRTRTRASAGYFAQLAASRPDIALCRAAAAVARTGEEFAERHGYLVGQHLVLKMLHAVGPCSQQILAEELRIDRSVMVGLCEDLEREGCVRRERNPEDRRAYAVSLTPKGRAELRTLERGVVGYLDEVLAPLDPVERAQLTTLLAKLLA